MRTIPQNQIMDKIKKTYVLDTNVLLHNPNALLMFQEHHVVIPSIVIDELDNHKTDKDEVGANARAVGRLLNRLTNENTDKNMISGIPLPGGGTLQVKYKTSLQDVEMIKGWRNSADLHILGVCAAIIDELSDTNTNSQVVLVTNDVMMRLKADVMGIKSENYNTDGISSLDSLYRGRREVFLTSLNMDGLYTNGTISQDAIISLDTSGDEVITGDLVLNEYLVIKCLEEPSKSAVAIYNGHSIELLPKHYSPSPCGIKPKNVGQKLIIDAASKSVQDAPLVIVQGPAGTGKTLMALAVGLEEIQSHHTYKKILYLRGNTKLDEDIGFLPGTEAEKLEWALRPVRDNLEVLLSSDKQDTPRSKNKNSKAVQDSVSDNSRLTERCNEIFEKGIIDIEAIAHMRGRSISNTYVVVDEAQNLTPKQIKTLISRCSNDTKMILLGDPHQIDHPYLDSVTNGLCYAADRMAGSHTTHQITLDENECERSELSLEVSKRMFD